MELWTVPEFFALLAAHIPCHYESLITYYGIYSSGHRGKLKCENREERIEEIVVETVPVTSGTQQSSSWTKWIRKIYETDPLTSSKYWEPMRITALIIGLQEAAKILEHKLHARAALRLTPNPLTPFLRLQRHELSIP